MIFQQKNTSGYFKDSYFAIPTKLFLRQSPNARDADGLAFARGDVFISARTNQHRALRRLINPFARLIRFFVYFNNVLRYVVFHSCFFGKKSEIFISPSLTKREMITK